jgi:hypothetical protein
MRWWLNIGVEFEASFDGSNFIPSFVAIFESRAIFFYLKNCGNRKTLC